MIRLDPQPDGRYERVQEVCLAKQISEYLGGAPVGFVLGAYNTFLPLRDTENGERVYAIGMEAFIPATGKRWLPLTVQNQRSSKGSFYAGALYALRDAQGHWRVGEVGGKFQPGQRALVSIYTFSLSP